MKTISQLTTHNSQLTTGYTLIEVLIAAGIFAIAMSMVMSTFSVNSNIQNQTKAIREASVSARYAVEAMAREFRLAANYEISNSEDSVTFYSYDESDVKNYRKYLLGQCHSASTNTAICVSFNGRDYQPLTSPDINVSNVSQEGQKLAVFNDRGSFTTGTSQPFLEIKFTITTTLGKKLTEQFSQTIETTIASRAYPGFSGTIASEQQN